MDELQIKISRAFLNLWDGYERRHLELSSHGVKKNEKGKVEANAATVDGPLTETLVWRHINGDVSIGVAPVRADSTCRFGVLDVDWYDMPEDDVKALASRLRTRCAAFRTKSRGLHIYVFVDEPISAKLMHDYLAALRRRLPKNVQSKTELFPKATQVAVTPENEPTAVNLPLKGQQREPAWFIDHEGEKYAYDDTSILAILEHLDQHCRVSASLVSDIAKEQPTLDHSDSRERDRRAASPVSISS